MRPAERAVVDALLPSGACPELPLGAFDSGFDSFYTEFRRVAPFALKAGFRGALLAAIWVSPLLIGRLPPFTRLSPDERELALETLGRSRLYPLRQSLLVLKAVLSFHYGAVPAVRAAVGGPK